MSLSKVIEAARGDIGYHEEPAGSNRVKYWDEYDPGMQGQPWCVVFLWSVFRQAGESAAFCGGEKTASCGALLRRYREQGLIVPVERVQAGDIVILNFHNTNDAEHCGLVSGASGQNGRLMIRTIEGNTSPSDGSQSSGGMVCEKTRCPNQIVAVCRPRYKAETGDPSSGPSDHLPSGEGKDDITGHWAEQSIRSIRAAGLMQGYPDGSFRPDQPVTRAELAVILKRWEESK